MKKQLLTTAALTVFAAGSMLAQNNFVKSNSPATKNGNSASQQFVKCGSPIPSKEWDDQFNALVEKYVKDHTNETGKLMTVPAQIPVIVHIIHNGTAVGSGANISAAQVASQITVLNNDYAGTNSDITSVPSTFTSVKANDCQISFCLALTDPNGNTLAEPGIERMTYTAAGATSDPNTWTISNFQTNFDGQIKPNTIWDATKYMNIWVTRAGSSGLLGYASFPAASGLTGLSGLETANTSGVVINYQGFGTMGSAAAPYNKGRTATHEVGHWLGLRHIWGDGTCATDYCNDTPPANTANYNCETHPFNVGTCSGNTTGEMFMNYMDYTPDACMYMFTANQKTRMQTAMTNGTYRKFLGTHGICSSTPTAPVANFTMASTGCVNTAVSVSNSTSGSPTPTYVWSSSPSTGVTFSSTTAANPTVTFANAGTYTVSVTATNTQGSSSDNSVITITSCAVTSCDTLMNLLDTNTITVYNDGGGGYVTGNNSYGDTHKGEYYTAPSISGNNVTGVITYFYLDGTVGTGNLAFQLYNGDNTAGPTGAAVKSDNVSIATINANGVANGSLLAYVHTFSTPYTLTANEFHSVIQLPTTVAAGDTAAILSGLFNVPATNTAWEKWSGTTGAWYPMGTAWSQTSLSLAIFPIICPPSVGLAASELNNQVVIYPNPSTGIINFAFAMNNKSDVKIEVTNMLGQVVYSSVETGITANTKSIELKGASKGVYLVTVSTATDKMVRKVVIE